MNYLKTKLIFSLLFIIISIPTLAQESISQKLAGKILLQAELNGEAWYLHPTELKRYFLGRPNDAFNAMRNFGIGISNNDLDKIPVGFIENNSKDSDNDGIPDDMEIALGTDPFNPDTDGDGFDDKTEIINGYNPLGIGKINISIEFTEKHLGKIFIQVERNGEAWYVNPGDKKRYFLGRPADAFSIMRSLSIGITNQDIKEINIGNINTSSLITEKKPVNEIEKETEIIYRAASAIRARNVEETLLYFKPEVKHLVKYSLNKLDNEGILALGNTLSSARLTKADNFIKRYTAEVYFSGETHLVHFYIEKQEDGTWLMMNL